MRHFTLTLTPALRLACLCAALSPAALLAQTAPAPAAAAASAPAAPKPAAGGVYKWKDASGKMQYSDKPPAPNASSLKLNNDAPSAAEAQAARDRLEAMKAESASRAAARGTPTGAPVDANAKSAPADESACQAKWREYNESYACFDPYRLVGGGIRPEAFEKCKVVKQPSEPCK